MATVRRRLPSRIALVVALAVASVAPVATSLPVVAGGPSCIVTNLTRGGTARTLAGAVKTARPGDRLQVKGVCFGSTTIDRDLTIVGKKTAATGDPTLDGKGISHVLRVQKRVTVEIVGLTIAHGNANGGQWPNQSGGGIFSAGKLTLRRVLVAENFARASGGGLRLEGPTTLIGTTVSYNGVTQDGDGCGIATSAPLTIRGGAVRNNVTTATSCVGAGIAAWEGSRVRLLGSVRIEENDAGIGDGAGVQVYNGASLAVRDSSVITGNVTTGHGGGIYAMCNGVLTSEGAEASHVFGNTPDDIAYAC